MSGSTSGGMIAPGHNGGGGGKRSSPLNYFSLDIPASLAGSASSPSLPHQSCSLPFVARLVRTPSTSSAGHSDSFDQQVRKV